MSRLVRMGAIGLVLVSLLTPTAAYALTFPFSFGGRIVTVVPCSLGLHVTIKPAGLFPITYIWTPATVTKLAGPPRNPGQQILGLADAPIICFVGFTPLFGFRMTLIGTSALF